MTGLRRHALAFAVSHDNIPAFHAASILLTVIAAALFNTGAFALLIAAHASLDVVKYREIHGMKWSGTLAATARESLLDLFFLSLALCLALYLHHGQSVFVLSGITRLEEILVRVFGIMFARFEVLWHGLWVFSDIRQHLRDVRDAVGPWRPREILWLSGLIGALLFIAVSPFVLKQGVASAVLYEQLTPWRI
ncbi:hypothetical protein HYW84_04205 [Candidatus Peregrinibacteria bacterium]|nr:hypothetical protein [Candidatus Peregrinibacteria bacterium]